METQEQQIAQRRTQVMASLQESAAQMSRDLDVAEKELGADKACIERARAKVENSILWVSRSFGEPS